MDLNSPSSSNQATRQLPPLAAILLACRRLPLIPTAVGLILAALVLSGFIAMHQAQQQIEDKMSAQARASGMATVAHVDRILDDSHRTLSAIAGLIDLREPGKPIVDDVLLTAAEQLNLDRPQTAALAIIEADGQATLLDRKYSGQRFDVSGRPYFPYARESSVGSYSYGPPTRNTNTGSVNVPVMLKIEHDGRELILATAFVESRLQSYLQRLAPGASGFAALILQDEGISSPRVLSMAGPLSGLTDDDLARFMTADTWPGDDGQVYRLSVTRIAQSPIVVVTGYSNDDIFAALSTEQGPQVLLYSAALLILALGSLLLLVFVGRNLETAEQVLSSEQHFRDLVEGSLQGIWIHRDYRPLFVNQAALRILGFDSEEEFLALRSIDAFIAPRDRQRLREYHQSRVRGEKAPATYEFYAIRQDGAERVLLNAVRTIEWNGLPAVQCAIVDITEAHDLAERLAYEASHDELTGLFNRRAFLDSLQSIIEKKPAGERINVLFVLDLDWFKVVNDACGHAAGDILLRQVAQLLRSLVRDQDTIARLGGDEFAILLCDFPRARIEPLAQTLLDAVGDYRFVWEKQSFNIGLSIGIAPIGKGIRDVTELMSMADNACFVAKEHGRNRYHVYSQSDFTIAQRSSDMRWVARFDEALTANRFFLVAQPVADLQEQAPGLHFELLLRMESEDGNPISPSVFLPTAERFHVATRIDRWVIEAALAWLESSPDVLESLYLCNINLSGQTVADPVQRDYFVRQIAASTVPAEKLCFEITETAAMMNIMSAVEFMKDLSELGCRFALDDFGSGLSSFGYLKSLPIDFVKIDGQFVRSIGHDPVNLAIVRAIHQVGKATGKKTVAEFVEDEQTLNLLQQIGVDFAQGYFIGRPQPIEPAHLTAAVRLDYAAQTSPPS